MFIRTLTPSTIYLTTLSIAAHITFDRMTVSTVYNAREEILIFFSLKIAVCNIGL